MTNNAERQFRITEVMKLCPQKEILKEKFAAQMICKWGFSRRTIMEYLNALIMAGHLQEGGEGMIWRK